MEGTKKLQQWVCTQKIVNSDWQIIFSRKESELESLNQSLRGLQKEKDRITALHEESLKQWVFMDSH